MAAPVHYSALTGEPVRSPEVALDELDEPERPRRRFNPLRSRAAVQVVTLAIGVGAWELYGRAQETRAAFAPASDVAVSLVKMLGQSEFWSALGGTVTTFFIGVALAIVLGVPVGIAMGRYLVVGRVLDPYMKFLLALPMSTLVPVVIISVGVGLTARIVIVMLFAFVDVAYNTYLGMRMADQSRIDMGRSFNLSEYQLVRYIVVPSALPSIVVGIRLGTGRGLIGMVVSELMLVAVGIGLLIQQYQGRFQADNMLALTVVILAFGVTVMTLMQRLERRVLHWRKEAE